MLLVKQWHMQKLTKSLKAKERKINKNDYISMCLCVYMHYTGTCIETKMILSSMQEVPRHMHEQYISSKTPAGGIEIGCLSL